jgi:Skp family chaperone for outer membrane proteins
LIRLALIMPMFLVACQKEIKPDSSELKKIREELEKSNRRLEDMQRNQRIEREGKALENQKSYFQ